VDVTKSNEPDGCVAVKKNFTYHMLKNQKEKKKRFVFGES